MARAAMKATRCSSTLPGFLPSASGSVTRSSSRRTWNWPSPRSPAAYARCVERGATRIVVVPFFLGPGKHWTQDIPRLTAEVAARFPDTRYHVTPTLGIDDLILDLLDKRAQGFADHDYTCDICRGTLRSGELPVR